MPLQSDFLLLLLHPLLLLFQNEWFGDSWYKQRPRFWTTSFLLIALDRMKINTSVKTFLVFSRILFWFRFIIIFTQMDSYHVFFQTLFSGPAITLISMKSIISMNIFYMFFHVPFPFKFISTFLTHKFNCDYCNNKFKNTEHKITH